MAQHTAEINLRKMQLEMASLRMQLIEQKELSSIAQKQTRTCEQQVKQLTEQLAQREQDYYKATDSLKQQLHVQSDVHEKTVMSLNSATEEIETLSKKLESVTNELSTSSETNTQLVQQQKESQIEIESLKNKLISATSHIPIEIAKLSEELKAERSRRATDQNSIAELTTRLNECEALYNSTKAEIPKYNETITELQRQLDEASQQASQMQTMYSSETAQLRAQLADVSSEFSKSLTQVQQKEAQVKEDIEQQYSQANMSVVVR